MRSSTIHHPRWLSLLTVAATLLLATRASAAQVVVVVGGDADQATRQQLSEAVVQALREKSADPGERKLKPADVDALIECVAGEASQACAAAFMEASQASRAVVMRVRREPRRASTTIYGWALARAGTVLAINQRVCENCTDAKLANSARALVDDLLREVETRTLPTTLVVRTNPPGAEVELDGRIVGVTPYEHGVFAGRHRIVLSLRGHEPSSHEREVLAGETTTMEVTLKPDGSSTTRSPGDKGATAHPRAFQWQPWAVAGTGAAITLAGAGLLLLDEDGDAGHPRYEHRETAAWGIGSLAAGAAVTTLGVVWLLRTTKEPHDHDKSRAPGVALGAGGALVVYGGTF